MIALAKTNSYKWCWRIARWGGPMALGLLTYACARITAPEGGPKDTTPPKLIKTYPEQACTGFQGKMIKLVFDKAIEVRDLYNKLVVTPRLQKLEGQPSYPYRVRGNTLKLTLEAPLEEETTYNFNFNDAITDITEGNVAEEPVITFSTGDHIDAMYVTGQAKYLMTDQPASKVLVALYRADKDSLNILNSPPDYFVKADEEGRFKLDYVKKGQYYLYANNSKEKKLTVDPGVDEYGFLKDPIDLTKEPKEGVTLSLLQADVREFKLQGQQPQDQYFELSFNKPVVDYKLAWVHKSKRFKEAATLYSHLVEDKQVIRIYNTFGLLEEDSLAAHLTAQDGLGTVIEKTINIHFREGNRQNKTASYTFEPASGAAINPDFIGKMTLNKPVKEVVADRLFFVFNGQDTVHISAKDLQFNAQQNVVTINKQLDPKMLQPKKSEEKEREETSALVLHIEEEAFITVEGDNNEPKRYVYTFRNPKAYGTIQGQVTTQAPGFIVQLLDTNYKVMDEIRNEHNYQFKEVAPGNYKLRVLVLKAPEAAWEFGNIHERKEPDPVVFYPEEVVVIANWEITGIDFSF